MNIGESLSVALESLIANKMRALLTMLGVIIGVAAVITMLSLARGAREDMMSRIQAMGTNVLMIMGARGGARGPGAAVVQRLTLDDAMAIREHCATVEGVAPEVQSNAQVKYLNTNAAVSILGTTPDYPSVRNFSLRQGRFFTDGEVQSSRRVAVVGDTAARNLFGNASPIGEDIIIMGSRFTVIGLMTLKGSGGFTDPDDVIYIPVTTAMRRLFGLRYLRMISVQVVSREAMSQTTEEITALLRRRHRIAAGAEDDFRIRNQADMMEMADETSQTFTLLLAGIASVSLIVGGIGIMNIMLVSVTERTREIGIRKAVGARRRDIQAQFLVEAIVLSAMGGLLGVLLGVAASSLIGRFSNWSMTVSLPSIILSFGFASLVGVFFGFYPARQASRLDPIEALRYE